ncbi:MAG TPA: helix-turn-helix transcriptional regulator [Baekduia sp.]
METAEVDGAVRRRELADFLRTRRAALTPRDVGLPEGGRRRTPGLRREEVAQLAGVGTTWYTWLEQARDVRASRSVLEAVGEALRLTPAEHRHLLRLGRGEEVELPGPGSERVSATLQRLIANLGPNPAYLIGRRWDYLAWNGASVALFGDPAQRPEGRRNHVWALFTDPERRALVTDWEETTRSVVGRFRADAARHVGDPAFEELIDDLKDASAVFRRLWKRHEVVGDLIGRKVLRHPDVGDLVFEHAALRPAEAPDQRLVLYSPLPEADTAAKMMALIEARGG